MGENRRFKSCIIYRFIINGVITLPDMTIYDTSTFVTFMTPGLKLRLPNKNHFLISQPKLMLWVFKRSVSMSKMGKKNIYNFTLKMY